MWRMSDSGAAEALAALLDQSIVSMAAKGVPGPFHDRFAVQELADMWLENLPPVFSVLLTRSDRRREARARELLAWMAGHGPVRRRVMLDLAAGADTALLPQPHDGPVAPAEYTAERLALAGLQTMRIERDVLWPDGLANDPRFDVDARRFAGPELPLRRRAPETVADWSLRQADHTGFDLTRARLTALRVERIAGRWSAALEFDVLVPARAGRGFVWSEPLHVWVGGLSRATFDSADTEGLRLDDGGSVRVGAGGALHGADVTWTYNWFDVIASRGFGPVQWLWPRGAAAAAALALFQVLLGIRMAGRHRVVAAVPLAALTATIAGAGQDLLRAGRSRAALTALAAKWQARPAMTFDALADAGPPAGPVLLAWHAADDWAAWHAPQRWTPGHPERPEAVYATAFGGDRLRGGQHLGPARLRLSHRGEALTFELEPGANT